MDFNSYVEKYGCEFIVSECGYGAFADRLGADARADLYSLTDYRVMSHVGGIYWLIRKGR